MREAWNGIGIIIPGGVTMLGRVAALSKRVGPVTLGIKEAGEARTLTNSREKKSSRISTDANMQEPESRD